MSDMRFLETIKAAEEQAARRIDEAKADVERIKSEARERANALVEQAWRDADETREAARRKAEAAFQAMAQEARVVDTHAIDDKTARRLGQKLAERIVECLGRC